MTLGHRQALAELERVRASRDSLQVALDDMRRQVRAQRDVLDLRDPLTQHAEGVQSNTSPLW